MRLQALRYFVPLVYTVITKRDSGNPFVYWFLGGGYLRVLSLHKGNGSPLASIDPSHILWKCER